MLVTSLGYVRVTATDLRAWRGFATEVLATEVVDGLGGGAAGGGLALRLDGKCGRIFVLPGERDGIAGYGFEVADATALDEVVRRIGESGNPVRRGSAEETAQRRVADLAIAQDPAGNCIEFYYGLADGATPFAPARPMGGFRTGHLGMGHAVLTVEKLDRVKSLYCDVLGFKPTDYITNPFSAFFLHVNRRHHSFALIETGKNGIHHLMIEVQAFDDVGMAYDVAQQRPGMIATTLGRHANDHVTSFYAWTPSGFMLEYGWGGIEVDDATWQAHENTLGPSLWGHERSWITEEQRVEARKLRAKAAAAGVRAPLHVMPGEFDLASTE